MRNNNHILHGDLTRVRKFLQGRPRMLTRDLFVVANFLVETSNYIYVVVKDTASQRIIIIKFL